MTDSHDKGRETGKKRSPKSSPENRSERESTLQFMLEGVHDFIQQVSGESEERGHVPLGVIEDLFDHLERLINRDQSRGRSSGKRTALPVHIKPGLLPALKRVDAEEYKKRLKAFKRACKSYKPSRSYARGPIFLSKEEEAEWEREEGRPARRRSERAVQRIKKSFDQVLELFREVRQEIVDEIEQGPQAAKGTPKRRGRSPDPDRPKRDRIIVKEKKRRPKVSMPKLAEILAEKHPEYTFTKDIVRHALKEARDKERKSKGT